MWGDLKTPPKCVRKEIRCNFYSRCSIVAATGVMSWRRCVSLWKQKYFVWDPKEDTTRNQWFKLCLQHCSRTVQPKYWSVCSAFYGGLFPEAGRVAYNAVCSKTVSIKWSNSSFTRTVWCFWLTACKYVFIFKEFATDDSNTSFEQCRVVLVVCRFYDHKCRHGNVYAARFNATHKKKV